MSDLEQLHEELSKVKQRNQRVELEKAWETSKTRSVSIIALTYFVMCCVFYFITPENFWINAIVPTLGYFLSTVSLPFIKKMWLNNISN